MDTYTQPVTPKRRYRALEEKRRIVEETLAEGTSVAQVARAHGVNANLVFNWRRRYQAGLLGGCDRAKLLPVKVTPESSSRWTGPLREPGSWSSSSSSVGAIHIQLQDVQVRIEGSADPVLLRVLLECLRA
jgi:transposase